jgi:hypothetical protein
MHARDAGGEDLSAANTEPRLVYAARKPPMKVSASLRSVSA